MESKEPVDTFTLWGKTYNIKHKNKHNPPSSLGKVAIVFIYLCNKWINQTKDSIKNIIITSEKFIEKHNLAYADVILVWWSLMMGGVFVMTLFINIMTSNTQIGRAHV